MKTTHVILSFATVLVLFSCKKNDVKKTSDSSSAATEAVEKTEKDKETSTVSYPYKASDGSRAKATFIQEGDSKTITIEANRNKFVLDFQQATPAGEIYERSGISAEATEDSLLISQGDNIIHLEKIK